MVSTLVDQANKANKDVLADARRTSNPDRTITVPCTNLPTVSTKPDAQGEFTYSGEDGLEIATLAPGEKVELQFLGSGKVVTNPANCYSKPLYGMPWSTATHTDYISLLRAENNTFQNLMSGHI